MTAAVPSRWIRAASRGATATAPTLSASDLAPAAAPEAASTKPIASEAMRAGSTRHTSAAAAAAAVERRRFGNMDALRCQPGANGRTVARGLQGLQEAALCALEQGLGSPLKIDAHEFGVFAAKRAHRLPIVWSFPQGRRALGRTCPK